MSNSILRFTKKQCVKNWWTFLINLTITPLILFSIEYKYYLSVINRYWKTMVTATTPTATSTKTSTITTTLTTTSSKITTTKTKTKPDVPRRRRTFCQFRNCSKSSTEWNRNSFFLPQSSFHQRQTAWRSESWETGFRRPPFVSRTKLPP